MEKKQGSWTRLASVIKWANMSTNYFAHHIGLSRGENLYQIKRGNNGISLDLAERIVSHFPEIDRLWLLTGEGDMFGDERLRGAQIPYYDADPETELAHLDESSSKHLLYLPIIGACDLAMCYRGAAMAPRVPVGTILMLKQVPHQELFSGDLCVAVRGNTVLLRMVQVDGEQLRLVAENSADYPMVVWPRSEIDRVYKIKATLSINPN